MSNWPQKWTVRRVSILPDTEVNINVSQETNSAAVFMRSNGLLSSFARKAGYTKERARKMLPSKHPIGHTVQNTNKPRSIACPCVLELSQNIRGFSGVDYVFGMYGFVGDRVG